MVERGVSGEQLENAKAIRWPKTGPLYRHILGTSIKVQKSVKVGWLTAVIYLAPEKESIEYGGINLCPLASKGCPIACLAGNRVVSRLAMSSGRNSKAWKTLLLIYGGGLFEIFLDRALTSHTKTAEKKGLVPAIRLNGSSDWVWESRAPEIFRNHPAVTFYDYTKIPARFDRELPPNYHLTFSRSEDSSWPNVQSFLGRGINVAVVFTSSRPIDCGSFMGERVVDGDKHDARPTDEQTDGRGSIVGLSIKSKAKDDGSGFFVDPTTEFEILSTLQK